jgi:hypothetical protein
MRNSECFVPHEYRTQSFHVEQKKEYISSMDQRTKVIALDKIDFLRERIEELKSWLKENSQGSEVAQPHLAESRSDAHCNCDYLAALEDALSLLLDETESLLNSPNSDKESNTYRTLTSDSEGTPALNSAAVAADALPTDRRIRSLARRRGERRTVGLEPGSQGRRRTDRIAPKI